MSDDDLNAENDDGLYPNNVRRKINEKDLIRVTLPKEYWGANIDGIANEKVRAIVSRFCKHVDKMVERGYGLLLVGQRGTGKTACAAIILKEAIRRYISAYFITIPRLRDLQFDDKNLLYGDGSDGITIRQKIRETDLLVIDGVDIEFFTDNVFGPQKMAHLLRERRSSRLSTIVTGSYGKMLDKPEYSDFRYEMTIAMQPLRIQGEDLGAKRREAMADHILGGE